VWVVAANASDREAALRVTTFGAKGATATRERLAAGALAYVPVPAEEKASATVMESFGPAVGAGMVTIRPDGGGLGAEPCASRAGTRWMVPEGSSVRGQSSHLVVVNPFAQAAVIDVSLITKDGPIRPGRLSGVVIKPRRTVSYDLNQLALGKEPLTVNVQAGLGKVAVGGLDVAAGEGLRSVLAVPGPARTWILPGAADDGTSDVIVTAGSRRVPFLVRAQGPESQVVVLEEGSVSAESALTSEVEAPDAGLVVEAEGPAPFVAGRRLSSGVELPPAPPPTGKKGKKRRPEPPPPPPESTDSAATSGAPGGGTAWLSLPAVGPGGGRSTLILENAGTEEVTVEVALLRASGAPQQLDQVVVPGGVTVTVDLVETVGEGPAAAVVSASGPSLVVAQAGVGPDGYAVALGSPMEPSGSPGSLGI
jgi:hypothetical protein